MALIQPGGKIDLTMIMGRTGMFNIIEDRYAKWSLQKDGNFVKNIKKRGVDNPKLLPNYHYRDDGRPLWRAIEEYVQTAITGYYGQ